jgi:hypothetical protein
MNQMNEEINSCKNELQKLIDLWNELNSKPITDYKSLFQLIHDPYSFFPKEAVNVKIAKDVSVNVNEGPVPNKVYVQCRACKKNIHIGRVDLWSIDNGKTVVLNDTEFERFIHSQDVFAKSEQQKEFAELVVTYVNASNELSEKLRAVQRLPGVPFSLTGRSFPYISDLKLETPTLQSILDVM